MEKIIQVTKAPSNLYARFLKEDESLEVIRVVCIGVSVDGGVHYIPHSEDGFLDPVTEYNNFYDVVFI